MCIHYCTLENETKTSRVSLPESSGLKEIEEPTYIERK